MNCLLEESAVAVIAGCIVFYILGITVQAGTVDSNLMLSTCI